ELWLQDARASGARTHVEVAQGDGGRVLGYCAWRLEGALHSPSLHVLGLAVEGRQRRRGTGKALLLRALSFGEAAGAALAMLHVRADNQPAQRLYRRLGFLRVARVLGYYGDSDAWELLRELPAMEKRDVDQKLVLQLRAEGVSRRAAERALRWAGNLEDARELAAGRVLTVLRKELQQSTVLKECPFKYGKAGKYDQGCQFVQQTSDIASRQLDLA
ncbi:unnamed protein product, partial [Effrenium voratum]